MGRLTQLVIYSCFFAILNGCSSMPTNPPRDYLYNAQKAGDVGALIDAKNIYLQAMDQEDIKTLYSLEKMNYQENLTLVQKSATALPLHYAIKHNKVKLFKFAVNAGYDINTLDEQLQSPLMLAVKAKSLIFVEKLISLNVDVRQDENAEQSILLFVTDKHPKKIMMTLLQANADYNNAIRNKKIKLYKAKNPKSYEYLIEYPQQIKKLIVDIMIGNLYNVQKYINKDYSVNTKTKNGHLPLNTAVLFNKPQIVAMLIKAGADLNASNDDWTPLMNAVDQSNQQVLKELLSGEQKPNLDKTNRDGWTALMLTMNGNNDLGNLANILIYYGADLNKPKNDGYTPLNQAVRFNKHKVFANLINAGANPNIAADDGLTPLMNSSNSLLLIKKLVLLKNIDLNILNKKDHNRSALDYAIKKGNYKVINLLRSAGAKSGH